MATLLSKSVVRVSLLVCGAIIALICILGIYATNRAAVQPPACAGGASNCGTWGSVIALDKVPVHLNVLPSGQLLYWAADILASTGDDEQTIASIWTPPVNGGGVPPQTAIGAVSPNIFCAGHSFLPGGQLLITGGHIFNGHGTTSTMMYDTLSKKIYSAGEANAMNLGRWYPTNVTLPNGEVLTVGGSYCVSSPNNCTADVPGSVIDANRLPQVWKLGGGWRDLSNVTYITYQTGTQPTDEYPEHYYPWLHVAPNGHVFNSGHDNLMRYLNTSGAGSWVNAGTQSSTQRDYGSSVIYQDPNDSRFKVLIVGGGYWTRRPGDNALYVTPVSTAEVIDLGTVSGPVANPTAVPVASMGQPRRHLMTTILADGKILATGGTKGVDYANNNDPADNEGGPGNVILSAELWDPAAPAAPWKTLAPMTVQRLYHSTAVLLPDARVLVAGGGQPLLKGERDDISLNVPGFPRFPGDVEIDQHRSAEIFTPPYLHIKGTRPLIDSAPGMMRYGNTYFVSTSQPKCSSPSDPNGDCINGVNLIRLSTSTHAYNMDQRINRLAFTQAGGGLNITAPSGGSICPPGFYMLFLIDKDGVPSIAKTVRVVADKPTSNDFDGDGKTDQTVWGEGTGKWDLNNSLTGINTDTQWGSGTSPFFDIPVAADYDGDGITDPAVWRTVSGSWNVRYSTGIPETAVPWGIAGSPDFDIPVPGDYDGDGRADYAIYRRAGGGGVWWVKYSSGIPHTAVSWGISAAPRQDIPVPGDYDGDGKTDYAVWSKGEGNWYIKYSSGIPDALIFWGNANAPDFDIPVPGDYDGDGKTDTAIWRRAGGGGVWWVNYSSGIPHTAVSWGISAAPANDLPVPGDYDGDGKTDLAIWRRDTSQGASGGWWILRSSDGGTSTITFGTINQASVRYYCQSCY
jgi:hypothetical protein